MDWLPPEAKFELKYTLDEARAQAVRQAVAVLATPDPHADARSHSYPVYTLYLDSADLALYNAVREGHGQRLKLRVRYYERTPDSPVVFEIKCRHGQVVVKYRAVARRRCVPRLLAGQWPAGDDVLGDANALAVLRRFCLARDRLAARPVVLVSYRRQAYVRPADNDLRVTFDREVQAGRSHGGLDPYGVRPVAGSQVILEVKFTHACPGWVRGLVHGFGLERVSCSKYASGVQTLALATAGRAGARPGRVAA